MPRRKRDRSGLTSSGLLLANIETPRADPKLPGKPVRTGHPVVAKGLVRQPGELTIVFVVRHSSGAGTG